MPKKSEPRPRHVTVIRYQLRDGTRCKAGDPGAIKIKTQSDAYYLHLPPAKKGGNRRRFPLETTDLAVAWKRLRDKLAELHRDELGISDDSTRQAGRPIGDHVDEWLAAVVAGGVGVERERLLRSRVCRLITLAGWRRITDVKKSSCLAALARLQSEGVDSPKKRHQSKGKGSAGAGKGISAQTRNHYLGHVRQFTSWLADEGRLPGDPLAGMKGVNVERDRRHDRRVPEDLEVRVLFEHLQCLTPPAPVRCKMTGPQRALGYAVAMCAGLRAGELRRLTPPSFSLDSGDVRVSARSDKAGRKRVQAIPRWLAEKVRVWLAGGGELWSRFPQKWPGRVLQADLAAARNNWLAEEGITGEELSRRKESSVCLYEAPSEDGPLYVDFHALRHWYVTQVAATDGISPSTLFALSRHVDPAMTLGVYAAAKREGVRAAVEQLPDLS